MSSIANSTAAAPIEPAVDEPVPAAKPNPFDPATLRIDRNSVLSSGPQELITRISVGKPHKQSYIRTHPDPSYQVVTRVIHFKENEEFYLVQPHILPIVWDKTVPVTLHTAMKYPNALFVWPIRIPDDGEKDMLWWQSARDGADEASRHWTNLYPNKPAGKYQLYPSHDGVMPEPEWPALSFAKILEIAFRDYNIDTPEHPIVKLLFGRG
jgi:hypothetical protein